MAFHVSDVSVSLDPIPNSPQNVLLFWLQILVEALTHGFSMGMTVPLRSQ